jgi:hypothetical protein
MYLCYACSLEAFLDERLAVVARVGSTSKGYASTKMKVDAHQQVSTCIPASASTLGARMKVGSKGCAIAKTKTNHTGHSHQLLFSFLGKAIGVTDTIVHHNFAVSVYANAQEHVCQCTAYVAVKIESGETPASNLLASPVYVLFAVKFE